ncbi:MAG: hypothetical protein ACOYN4_05285 [Bacteroidales bacterium]
MKTPTTEHPILFSTPMVQAILERRKTMTRRTKGIPALTTVNELTHYEYKGIATGLPATHCFARMYRGNWAETIQAFCPYGQPGDKLWVRETWGLDYFGSGRFWHLKYGIELKQKDIVYKADDENRTRY